MENQERDERQPDQTTTPDDPTHEATTPPGNADRDEEAVEEAQDRLDEAGGGH
jgi:hypothetical protein